MNHLQALWLWLSVKFSHIPAPRPRLPRQSTLAFAFVGLVSLLSPEHTAPDAITVGCAWVRPVKPKLDSLASNFLGLALAGLAAFIVAMLVRAAFASGTHSRAEKFKDVGIPFLFGVATPIILVILNSTVGGYCS